MLSPGSSSSSVTTSFQSPIGGGRHESAGGDPSSDQFFFSSPEQRKSLLDSYSLFHSPDSNRPSPQSRPSHFCAPSLLQDPTTECKQWANISEWNCELWCERSHKETQFSSRQFGSEPAGKNPDLCSAPDIGWDQLSPYGIPHPMPMTSLLNDDYNARWMNQRSLQHSEQHLTTDTERSYRYDCRANTSTINRQCSFRDRVEKVKGHSVLMERPLPIDDLLSDLCTLGTFTDESGNRTIFVNDSTSAMYSATTPVDNQMQLQATVPNNTTQVTLSNSDSSYPTLSVGSSGNNTSSRGGATSRTPSCLIEYEALVESSALQSAEVWQPVAQVENASGTVDTEISKVQKSDREQENEQKSRSVIFCDKHSNGKRLWLSRKTVCKRYLCLECSRLLENWVKENGLLPQKSEMLQLLTQVGMSHYQLKFWFSNRRRRNKPTRLPWRAPQRKG